MKCGDWRVNHVIKWRDHCFSNGGYVAISMAESIEGFSNVGIGIGYRLDIPLLDVADATTTPPIFTLARSISNGSVNISNAIKLACISQSIGIGYLYSRDLVACRKMFMHLSIKLYATIATSIVDIINDLLPL